MVLSLAATCHWTLKQIDDSNAFLHCILKEEVFMKHPPGFVDSQKPDYVFHLHKFIYGLQKSLQGIMVCTLHNLPHSLGFVESLADYSQHICAGLQALQNS